MRRVGLVGAVVVLLALAAGAAYLVLRPGVSVASAVDADVTIVCAGSTGADADTCAAWGDAILAAEPPSTTFEMQDLARLEVTRSLLGFGDACEAAYFLGRYPDSAVWTEPVDCRP